MDKDMKDKEQKTPGPVVARPHHPETKRAWTDKYIRQAGDDSDTRLTDQEVSWSMQPGKAATVGLLAVAWLHGMTMGAGRNNQSLMWDYISFTLMIGFGAALWSVILRDNTDAKKMLAAVGYCGAGAYVMAISSALTWFRNPTHIAHLPDFGHDAIPSFNEFTMPAAIPFYGGQKWKGWEFADVFCGSVFGLTGVFVAVHPKRFVIGRRVALIYGTLMFFRSVTIVCTSLPDASPECQEATPGVHSLSQINLAQVMYRTIRIVSPAHSGVMTCGDMIFSGHTMMLVLCGCIWHSYYKFVKASINLVKCLIWICVVTGSTMLIAVRLHYTVDVILAFYFTITIWGAYHRMAHDIRLGYRFSTVWLIDGLILYPMLEWMEGEEAQSEVSTLFSSLLFSSPHTHPSCVPFLYFIIFIHFQQCEGGGRGRSHSEEGMPEFYLLDRASSMTPGDYKEWSVQADTFAIERLQRAMKEFKERYLDETYNLTAAETRIADLRQEVAEAQADTAVAKQREEDLKARLEHLLQSNDKTGSESASGRVNTRSKAAKLSAESLEAEVARLARALKDKEQWISIVEKSRDDAVRRDALYKSSPRAAARAARTSSRERE